MSDKLNYLIDVVGINHKNKDGEDRSDIVKNYLAECELSKVSVELKRHGGNKHDRNAIGVYISTPGFCGCVDEMIGFIGRDYAKEISPMIRAGGKIVETKITKVWIPERSNTATPYVTLSIKTDWYRNDILSLQKEGKEKRRLMREEKKNSSKPAEKKPDGILNRLIKFIFH